MNAMIFEHTPPPPSKPFRFKAFTTRPGTVVISETFALGVLFGNDVFGKMLGADGIHDMGVSKNKGTPKSSILIGFSIINHPFWGTPIFGNTHIDPWVLWKGSFLPKNSGGSNHLQHICHMVQMGRFFFPLVLGELMWTIRMDQI